MNGSQAETAPADPATLSRAAAFSRSDDPVRLSFKDQALVLLRLDDPARSALSLESRFDLAYNAAHALALAALRYYGYRCQSRY